MYNCILYSVEKESHHPPGSRVLPSIRTIGFFHLLGQLGEKLDHSALGGNQLGGGQLSHGGFVLTQLLEECGVLCS